MNYETRLAGGQDRHSATSGSTIVVGRSDCRSSLSFPPTDQMELLSANSSDKPLSFGRDWLHLTTQGRNSQAARALPQYHGHHGMPMRLLADPVLVPAPCPAPAAAYTPSGHEVEGPTREVV